MTMTSSEKRILEREALRSVIQQWNANRLDLFELSEPDENLQFHGVMRFYFQDHGQKVATKCIRVASDATVADVIDNLIEKFRPDMRMLSLPSYALYEVHSNGEERKLNPDEKPLLVQLNWHIDDREGRFLLRDSSQKTNTLESSDTNFKRKLSKREKKEQKKKEKLAKLNSNSVADTENHHVAEKLYTELPDTSFTRSISNPEAVMRRRRHQILEKKLQQFRSRDGGPDTGGTLKIYGESLCRDVPYKTLLLSIRDCAQAVVREMLAKYGLDKTDPLHYCLVQVNSDGTEYILDDDECPLSILMNHPTSRGSIMFHVRRRPADSQPRRRKKKPLGVSNGSNNMSVEREGTMLVEITHSGDGGRRVKLSTEPVEVGSANTNALQLFGPSIQPRHCLISLHEGVCTVTPLHADALTFVNGHHIQQPTILHNGSVVMFGRVASYRFVDAPTDGRYNLALSQSQLDSACLYERVAKNHTTELVGQEPILPAVLEFPETHQDAFLNAVITDLDVNLPNFKLSPVYTLYLCARYRASTHYRPDLQPTERAHKLTVFLHHVANLIYNIVQDQQYQDSKMLSFWMANSSEFLHFLKSDRHISAFSVQAQEVLAESVQMAFRNLVNYFKIELNQTLNQFLSENINHESAAGLVLTVLGSAMELLRRCRVNAALTIQLFSQLFHYINCICFNTVVKNPQFCTEHWGKVINDRLHILEGWARRQGLEIAAECHLAKIKQCAEFLQTPKTSIAEAQQLACSYFRLNSLQMSVLLSQEKIPKNIIDAAVRMAESVADELTRADGREVCIEESQDLPLALLIPDDGFSCDVVRGIPAGLVDFLSPLQAAGMCRLAAQPTSIGLWTVYMHQYNARSSSSMSSKLPQPEIQVIKLHKNSNGMGLSIVAAKGAGQERLGIYIKSVVPGGAADADGRLQAGDQLLKVDGQSLIGITQERAADYLVRTGPVVTLEVAKQGAIYHGLATLLQQPSPVIQRGSRKEIPRLGADSKPPLPVHGQQLPNSKSVPALHHMSNSAMAGNKSRSIHNLTGNSDQSFYQNLSIYRAQNQSHGNLGESINQSQLQPNSTLLTTASGGPASNSSTLNRPASAYFNNPTVPSASTGQMPSATYMMGPPPPAAASGGTTTNRTKPNFMRDSQAQQSLRMNQMMAPSMPNIAHSSGYTSNMLSSQSMQNVNMIQSNQQIGGYHYNHQMSNPNIHPHGYNPAAAAAAAAHHHQQQQQQQQPLPPLPSNQHSHLQSYQPNQPPIHGRPPAAAKIADDLLKKKQQTSMQNLDMQLNMVKQLPPTAPKPQLNRSAHQSQMDLSPPLPPTSTHPLYKPTTTFGSSSQNLNTTVDHQPIKGQFYHQSGGAGAPVGPQSTSSKASFSSGTANPWEREEREKEQEIRREHIRHWRDIQINELQAIPHRTQSQDEQLKTLLLERDFNRRALEMDDIEEDNDMSYSNMNVHETIRLTTATQQSGSQISPPIGGNLQTKQTDLNINSIDAADPYSNYLLQQQQQSGGGILQQQQQQPASQQQQQQQQPPLPPPSTSHVQPKSILKHNTNVNRTDETNGPSNPTSPSKQSKSASFATDNNRYGGIIDNTGISQISRDLATLNFNQYESTTAPLQSNIESAAAYDLLVNQPPQQPSTAPPPPPPERNSSYIIMSQKQQHSQQQQQQQQRPHHGGGGGGGGGPTFEIQSTTMINTNPKRTSNSISNNNNANNNNYNSTNQNTLNNNPSQPPPPVGMQLAMTHTQSSAASHQMTLSNLMANRDNKRVSFHDEENNTIMNESIDLNLSPEDIERLNQDTSALLQSPILPENESWTSNTQLTPGVIGAQEVYRDPRMRRLQEKQQQQQQQKSGEVPEKLSFKEKMKMFALESGENQTPKDKLKISRAQRDIDAVH